MSMQQSSRKLNAAGANAVEGRVVPDFGKSLWVVGMGLASLAAVALSSWNPWHIGAAVALTGVSLCCGHSVGLHRIVIHGAARIPGWLERFLVWLFEGEDRPAEDVIAVPAGPE